MTYPAPAAELRRTRLFLAMSRTIRRLRMFEPGDRVVVGLSGGPDSSALLHALTVLARRIPLELVAAHVHHGIRGELADRDALASEAFAARMGVAFRLVRADAPARARAERLSMEAAARAVRLEALKRVAAEVDARRIALGHTADDQAETVLMWVLRGTGLQGLAGIAPVRGLWVRPLIEVWRQDVLEYCRLAAIVPVQDETNLSREHLRNRIRLDLLPFIEERIRPGTRRALVRLAALARDDEMLLRQLAHERWAGVASAEPDGGVRLSGQELRALPPALARRILLRAFEEVSGGRRQAVGAEHIEALRELVERGRGGAVRYLPHGVYARLERGILYLKRRAVEEPGGPPAAQGGTGGPP